MRDRGRDPRPPPARRDRRRDRRPQPVDLVADRQADGDRRHRECRGARATPRPRTTTTAEFPRSPMDRRSPRSRRARSGTPMPPRRPMRFPAAARGGRAPAGRQVPGLVPTPYATVVAWVPVATQEMFFPIYADASPPRSATIARQRRPRRPRDPVRRRGRVRRPRRRLPGGRELRGRSVIVETLEQALEDVPAGVRARPSPLLRRLQAPPLPRCRRTWACASSSRTRVADARPTSSTCRSIATTAATPRTSSRCATSRRCRAPGPRRHRLRGRPAADATSSSRRPARQRRDAFEVATECGMARIDERGPGGPTLERLLKLHAEVAAPVR